MNSNIQVNEEYRFKISLIGSFLKDLFTSTSTNPESEKFENKIEELNKATDTQYISNLEKGMAPTIKNAIFNTKNVKQKIQNRNNDIKIKSANLKEENTEIKENGENEISL